MSTINEKLIRLNEYKNAIKQAIIDKGQTVTDNMSEYADAISKISGGGAELPTILDTDPLTFVRIDNDKETAYISINNVGNPQSKSFQYNMNDEGWQTYTIGQRIPMKYADKLQFKSTNSSNMNGTSVATNYRQFKTEGGLYNCGGLLTSLTNGNTNPSGIAGFKYLFSRTNIVSTPVYNNINVTASSFSGMFNNCYLLTKAKPLPINFNGTSCFYSMFENCVSLVNAPELPATVLKDGCYDSMFRGCISLVNAPELPATVLTPSCYNCMFYGCTSLIDAPALPSIELAQSCYSNMFNGCSSLVNAPELPATVLASSCYYYMFFNCKSLVKAPELPAAELVNQCYYSMFYNCSKLNYIKVKATSWNTGYASSWVSGVSSSGTFVKYTNTDIVLNSQNGIPRGWTVEDI